MSTDEINFKMASTIQTGALIRALSASKPMGKFLEIGTGTGLSACWLLDGMDKESSLISIDIDSKLIKIAEHYLGSDKRLHLLCMDAMDFLADNDQQFDFIFADFRPGKFSRLDLAIKALKPGGIYVVDDLLPQETWPIDHENRIKSFREEITGRDDMEMIFLNYDSGILVATKKQ